jgi:hypothetical protein
LDHLHIIQGTNPELISKDVNVYEDYGISRSFRCSATTQARNKRVDSVYPCERLAHFSYKSRKARLQSGCMEGAIAGAMTCQGKPPAFAHHVDGNAGAQFRFRTLG